MFIKIVIQSKDSAEQETEITYECKNYTINSYDSHIIITMQGYDGEYFCHEVFKDKDSSAYIMNNQGRTVDSYIWGEA